MRLRRDLCLGTLTNLPRFSAGFRPSLDAQLALVRERGFEGVSHWDAWEQIQRAGLIASGMARITDPEQALPLARTNKDLGLDFTALHVGTGFESDAEMDALAASVIDASTATGHALYVETHRATMTQDIKRTLDLVGRFPDLRFTLDFSHWYSGHEMAYGGEFAQRLAYLDPIFARVRSVQARIGTTGMIQRPLEPGALHHQHHMLALRACFGVLLHGPETPEALPFAPELLPARSGVGPDAQWLWYAQEDERSDRFTEACDLFSMSKALLESVQNLNRSSP